MLRRGVTVLGKGLLLRWAKRGIGEVIAPEVRYTLSRPCPGGVKDLPIEASSNL
jgi:hypothetical protein